LVAYPQLSKQQQKKCPKLRQAAIALPVLFEDSTHQLWHCKTVEGPMILKVCNQKNVESSPFWHGMNSLFNADFPTSLSNIGVVYQKMAQMCDLAIPRYIASASNIFVLSTWLDGQAVDASQISDAMIAQLANHLVKSHGQTQLTWGPFDQADIPAQSWSKQLSKTIQQLAENQRTVVANSALTQALQQAQVITVDEFVPIMPDLRWDQFLQKNNQLSALVDLDAFVIGPRELEFVLLEFILSQQQADLFKQHYQRYRPIPDLTEVRTCYRVLLFLMTVLGEKSLKNWLTVPAKF
jgi:hypothetical protein